MRFWVSVPVLSLATIVVDLSMCVYVCVYVCVCENHGQTRPTTKQQGRSPLQPEDT